ncbi:MAG: diphthine synthase [Nanoarchaeota archaeon]
MLHLIGIGTKKEHINTEMLDVIKNSSKVYLEYYTCFYETPIEELETYLNKKIIISNRDLIETKIEDEILNPSKKEDISLLVIGDPLIATTHTDLLLRAEKMNVKSKIYHNVSIANFIGKTGLQFYKFGKITSIPFFSEKFMPRTPFLTFYDNFKTGAHSLFLLDLNPSNDISYKSNQKYLKASDALEFLLKIPKIMLENEEIEEKDAQIINKDTSAIICSRLGFQDEEILYDNIEGLIKIDKHKNFKEPICIIIPGDLHDMEEEYLNLHK